MTLIGLVGRDWGELLSYDLLLNAVTAGLLLGGFYAAVTVGISISFGILDIVIIAHPAFYALGAAIYQIYYLSFEKRGQEPLRGLAFFFGILFITEVTLVLTFGVDYRYVQAGYI